MAKVVGAAGSEEQEEVSKRCSMQQEQRERRD